MKSPNGFLRRRRQRTSPSRRTQLLTAFDRSGFKVFVATAPCDLRANFNGLWAAAQERLGETPVRYQDPSLQGRCGQGYLWTGLVPGQSVVYEGHASRAARCLDSLLGEGFAGKLQCDGYSAYPAFAKGKADLKLFGCWAHARRNFFEAQEQAPRVAGWILKQIGLLYRREEQLRRNRAGPVLRHVQRSSHHRLVIERLDRALKKLQPRYLPQSLMGEAISYAPNQWPMLERFLNHGEVEIDNNLVENAIRPTALGKKNWLFFGSEEAGQRSAVIYTLIQNCRLLSRVGSKGTTPGRNGSLLVIQNPPPGVSV